MGVRRAVGSCRSFIHQRRPATADESFSDVLTKALKDDGISDSLIESTVKILTDEGFTKVELLQNVDTTVLKGMGIKTGPALSICKHFGQCKEKPPVPVSESGVKTLSPSAYKDMTTSQLLARLAEQPSDSDALGYLKETREVTQAEPKTQGRWAVVTGGGNSKKLNPQATLDYLSFINRGGANLSSYKGNRVTTIEVALGHGNDVWQHPLYAAETIVDGLDSAEVDWSDVPDDVMNALLWGRVTGSSIFASGLTSDREVHKQAAAQPLGDWLQSLVNAYKQAVEENSSAAVNYKKKQ